MKYFQFGNAEMEFNWRSNLDAHMFMESGRLEGTSGSLCSAFCRSREGR